MPTSTNKVVYHLVCSKKDKETFDRLYPKLLKVFLERAINKAINDKDFFEDVFFNEVN